MTIAALVLAAGGSSRFGSPKQLADWGGRPLLEHVVSQVEAWPVDRVAVVVGAEADAIVDAVDFGEAMVVINPEWEDGLASSLRVGLDALGRDASVEAAIIVLGDQPQVEGDVVRSLVTTYRRTRCKAVVPKYRYVQANPVLVDRAIWARLMSLEGDTGAKHLLRAHPEWVEEVWFDRLPPADVDTAADHADLRPRGG